MIELMREAGFGIPVMPQDAFYVFADASKWTEDGYQLALRIVHRVPLVTRDSTIRKSKRVPLDC